jgi:hypothetical protein
MDELFAILTPAPGTRFGLNDNITVDVLSLIADPSWREDVHDVLVRLGVQGSAPVEQRASPVAGRPNVWRTTFNAPGAGWNADPVATVMVSPRRYPGTATRISLRIDPATDSVTITSPAPGTIVTYPLTVTGTNSNAGTTVTVTITTLTGQVKFGVPVAASGASWSVQFAHGPGTECTLKAASSSSPPAIAQEGLNMPPPP